MADPDTFINQKKIRKAELITPPNILKQKVGSGGLDASALVKAQEMIENNETDFRPIASELINALDDQLRNIENGVLHGEASIEALLYPAMQLKAQGTMFHFPLISEISEILVSFLETVEPPLPPEVIEIISAHKMAISVIISTNMNGEGHAQGRELKKSLMDVCTRYYKMRKVQTAG